VRPKLADFSAFLALLPSPALVLDGSGRIAAANAPMARCLAVEPDALIGGDLAAWAVDPAVLRRFLDRGESSAELSFRAAHGGERRLALSIARDVLAAGHLVSIADMTAIRAIERDLQADVDRFRDMIGAGSGWFYEVDATLTRIRVFRRRSENGMLAMMDMNVNWPEDVIDVGYDPEGFAEVQRRWQAREPSRDVVHRVPRLDGKEIYNISSSVPFYDDKGEYQGRRGVSIDVTAQVLAERALRESEARLRRSRQHLERAQRIAAMGSGERDLTTGVEEWSPETYRIFGVDPASFALTDQNILSLIHEDDRERVKKAIAMAEAGRPAPPGEVRVVRPDGEVRTLHCEVEILFDGAGDPTRYLIVFKDVTELKTSESREQEMQRQLLHSQKLEAIGTLAGGISHELNNALVPVLALAKVTARRLPEQSRERANLETILQASERARDLVARILAFSRKDAMARCAVDFADLTQTALKLLRASLPSTVRIEERISPVAPVMGDPGELIQIIINLATNAAQAIGDRLGTITVELSAALGERLPQDPPTPSGAAIHLAVIDTGCGMDQATAARIFEPFFTTKGVGEGTGLGLSVVHGIVTKHGGRIAVESRPGAGTRFDVYLPGLVAVPAPPQKELRAS
jgi:PAS domain S-box-containing protein